MTAQPYNPLNTARDLKAAGADEMLAETIAGAIGAMTDKLEEKMATKSDLEAQDQRVAGLLEALEQRMSATLYRALWIQTGVIIAAVTAVTWLLP